MKPYFKAILFIVFLLIMLPLGTSADLPKEEAVTDEGYTVSYDGETYSLWREGDKLSSWESLTELLEEASGLGAPIRFSSVRSDEAVVISSGRLTLSGSISISEPILVRSGAEVTLCDINLTFTEGAYMNIRGGSVTLASGAIISDGNAVTLGLSSSSRFLMEGGDVLSSSREPCISVERGCASLLAGYVSNESGVALVNRATTELGESVLIEGAGYDIDAYEPLTLSAGGGRFSSTLSVRYMSGFERGTLTEVFFSASEKLVDKITLFDINGKEYGITFFESYGGYTEENFIGVYLPFTLTYSSFGTVELVESYLAHEPTVEGAECSREGFFHLGWYLDPSFGSAFYFGEPLASDTVIYAKYELEHIRYSINELSFEYDGKEHYLTFLELYHRLDGIYNFEWCDSEGRVVANTEALPLCKVSDSGEYRCKVTFTSGEYVTVAVTEYIGVEITKRAVEPPLIPSVKYTGRIQYPDISSTSVFRIEDEGFLGVGTYGIRAELTDPDNYRWVGTEDAYTYLNFEIMKADNAWVEELSVKDVYFGAEINFSCVSKFGEVKLAFSDYPTGEYASTPPTTVGVYYVKAVVEESVNWHYMESAPLSFSVIEDKPVSLGIEKAPSRTGYTAFDSFDTSGLVLLVRYSSGKEELVSGSSVSVHYQSADSLRVGHSGVFLEYRGLTVIVPVTVQRADYVFDLELCDESFIYDGEYHTLTPSGVFPSGKDGVAVGYAISGGGVNAGGYTVTLRFTVSSPEYNPIPDMTALLTVLPREAEVVWENTDFVYDGTSKHPTAYYLDIYGAKIPLSVIGSAVTVGESYSASAVCTDENYTLQGAVTGFIIRKADYDLSGVYWTDESFVYDGEKHTVYLSGLPEGISVVGYKNNSATDAGDFTAAVTLRYDSHNYNEPRIEPYVWCVERADYDMSGIRFLGGEYVFSGDAYYPTVEGSIPAGADGSLPEYSFSPGIVNASPLLQTVYVSFTVKSGNYNAPDTVAVPILVSPRGIYVSWLVGDYSYNGQAYSPEASAEECEVEVVAGGINAGEYTALAVSCDSNYYVINAEQPYTVKKAENRFVGGISVPSIFFGGAVSPVGEAYFGDVEFVYYTDASCENEIKEPSAVGVYYAVALVPESENYLEVRSLPMEFRIIAIVPVGIDVSLSDRAYVAFERLGADDLRCTVLFNDGSEETVDFSRLSVAYATAESLRAADSYVEVCYAGFSAKCSISVGRARLDLSGLVWQGLSHVYDGEEKTPSLTGLPLGVTVLEYVGAGASLAGEYTVFARLEYDRENYLEPNSPEAVMVIEKCPVTPVIKEGAVYNGLPQLPVVDSDLYYAHIDRDMISAGSYRLRFALTDTDNYYLTENYGDFIISAAPITLELESYTLYLGDSISDYAYTITDGEVAEGDELLLSFTVNDGQITAVSGNPNYTVSQTGGRIEYVGALSPERGRALLYALLAGILLILLFLVLVFRREAIVGFVAGFAERRKIGSEEMLDIQGAYVNTPKSDEDELLSIDVQRAEAMLSDSVAKTLIRKSEGSTVTSGRRKCIVNVDTISEHFSAGEVVDINSLKERGLIPEDAGQVKVLGRGTLDKPLKIYANRYSLSAVKMIALTGGEANKVVSLRVEKKKKRG